MRLALLAFLLMMTTGCTVRMGDFTAMSTRNVELSKMGTYMRGPRVTGEDVAQIFLFVPTELQPNIEDAFENAIKQVPGGVAMVDVVVRHFAWYFLYGKTGWEVEGTVLIDPALAKP